MGDGRTVFEILRVELDPAADAALLAALDGADRVTAQAIVETLLARGTREALLGLVQVFHALDESLRQILLIDWQRLFSILREAGQSRDDQIRINVLEIIQRACVYRASYLIEGALRHRSPNVRQAAANALCFLADELLRTAPVPVRDADLQQVGSEEIRNSMLDLEEYAEDRRQVVAAIEAGVSSFEIHHQPRVIEVALWFLDEMSTAFWSILSAPGSRVAQVAIQQLHKSLGPRQVPFVMAALNFSEFRPHVIKLLSSGPDPLFLEEWLKQSWRLYQPRMVRGMSALKELACAQRHGSELLQMASQAQRHLPRWIVSTGLGTREKIELLKDILHGGTHLARRSALWALTELDDIQIKDILCNVDDPDDPELARIAHRELALRYPGEMPIPRLSSSNDAGIPAQIGESDETAPVTFERYWRSFDGLDEAKRISLGRELLENVPLAQSILARRLADEDVSNRIRVVRIIACLGLAEEFQEKLYQLCHDSHSELRSVVITALSLLDTAVSRRMLRRALDDTDARVQANAVEAIGAAGNESAVDQLMVKLSSPDNRVQANAVKALLRLGVREAAEALFKMLHHENRMHRISALWLIERMGLFTLAARVTGMAGGDPDPLVRQRAIALTHNLSSVPSSVGTSALVGSQGGLSKHAAAKAEVPV